MSSRAFMAALALGGLSGCIPPPPGGEAREANVHLPDSYGGEDLAQPGEGEASGTANWREFWGDSNLSALVETALENNQELNIAVQEMVIANSEVMARRGEYLPSLSAGVGAGIDRVGQYTSQGTSDDHLGVPANLQNYQVGLYASWEVDIWGRLRNAADAAVYRYLASRAGRNFMVTRLVAEIANKYYELLALDRQMQIVSGNIELQQNALEMVRLQQQAARVTQLAVTRFEAQLRGWQSRQFQISQRIVATENEINFLVGRYPQHVARTSEDFLTMMPPVMHTGVPAQLLENRPDVQQAELEMRAAQLDVSAARAAFYPSLRLEGAVGYRSFDITHLFDTPGSILYSLVAGIAAPLLNRSGLTANFWAANAIQMRAVLSYERALLRAFTDVNTGLNLMANLTRSYELKQQQVDGLAHAVEISNMLFTSARADYLEVLTTQRDSLEAQMDLVELKQQQFAATVTVYQALGGGWANTQTEMTNAEPAGAVP
jgi:outer membrane protein, multidrug efflux system